MPLTNSQQIAVEEEARFLDSAFAPLDTSGLPSLQKPPSETFEPHDRYGLSNVDCSGFGAGSAA